MELSVIIINYNTFQLTCHCIQSLYEKLQEVDFEIVLVDNASSECDPQLFQKKFPGIRLVASKTNTGFAGGNNLGIAQASGNYILLLNSDTELINNAPKICLDHLKSSPHAGLVTARLEYPDGRLQYNCRRFRTITWELLEVFPVYWFWSNEKRENRMLHHYFNHQRFMSCDWVWGTFMLFPKSILRQLPGGRLPEDFFMYCEDVLWSWEIKRLGYEIHFLPEARVMHVHKGSADKTRRLQTRKTGIRNHAKFMKKMYPGWKWYAFALIYFSKQYAALGWMRLTGKI